MNTMTTGNLQEILRLAEQKRLTPERTTEIISSGALADLFDENADLGNRDEWRKALGHPPLNLPLLTYVRTFAPTGEEPTIAWRTDQFNDWFAGVDEGARASELTISKLERKAFDEPIIDALGGEKVAEVSLADFFATLAEKEERGDYTPLLGYAKSVSGKLHPVDGAWCGNGWNVYADTFEDDPKWNTGLQVVSRLSPETVSALVDN